jgi:hypothetical protein
MMMVMMEAVSSSETSVNFYEIKLRSITEDSSSFFKDMT